MTLWLVHFQEQTIEVEAEDEAEAHFMAGQEVEPDSIEQAGVP